MQIYCALLLSDGTKLVYNYVYHSIGQTYVLCKIITIYIFVKLLSSTSISL